MLIWLWLACCFVDGLGKLAANIYHQIGSTVRPIKTLCLSAILALLPFTHALAECNGESWTPDSRYELKNNGAEVYDTQTQLTWKRCPEGMSWNGQTCTGNPLKMSWFKLKDSYPATGDGWRVPNVDELITLRSGTDSVNETLGERKKTGCWNPAINAVIFPGGQNTFWSSSAYAGYAWDVSFGNGYVNDSVRDDYSAVWLVRAGQWFGPLTKAGKAERPYTFQPGWGYREMFAFCEKRNDASCFEQFVSDFSGKDPNKLIPQAKQKMAAIKRREEQQAKVAAKAEQARSEREAKAKRESQAKACDRLYAGKSVTVDDGTRTYGRGVVSGIGKGAASILITESHSIHYNKGNAYEFDCSFLR